MSAATEVLSTYQHVVDEVVIKPGPSGIFDVENNGDLVYSKHETGRHAMPGEILGLVREIVGPDIREYGT